MEDAEDAEDDTDSGLTDTEMADLAPDYETDDHDVTTQTMMPRHVRNNDSLSKYAHWHAGPLQASLPISRS